MRRLFIKKLCLFICSSVLFFQSSAKSLDKNKPSLNCHLVSAIEQGYLRQHIIHSSMTKEIKNRAIHQYIKRLDPAKIYFDQKDIKTINVLMNDFYKVSSGKNCNQYVENCSDSVRTCVARKQACLRPLRRCHALGKIQDIYLSRVKKRVKNAKMVLNKKFKINKKTSIQLSSDKRGYPKTQKDADRFQNKYLQFQVANFVAIGKKLEEAKEMVIRSYERNLRRLKDIKTNDILASYLDAYAMALDPHSRFFSSDALEDFEISMKLSLQGIGATLSSQDGFTVIEQLITGGAAYRSGRLREKDRIVSVGQGRSGKMKNVIEMDLRDVVRKIRGKKGTVVRLAILRKTDEGSENFIIPIVRDKIKLEDEAAAVDYIERQRRGKKQTVALVHLPSFYADSRQGGRSSAGDLKKILKDVKKKKVDAMVLDLSTNGGGSLDDAVKIAGLFFKTGNVVKQSSRQRKPIILKDTDEDVNYTGPLVILTSRLSASASEIVAGTLKDYNRAVIVGNDQTFGKGSVQSVAPIAKEIGALKVTVGMFFVPGGYSTQHQGVISDIKLPSVYTVEDVGEDRLDYSLPAKKIPQFLSKKAYVRKGSKRWSEITLKVIKDLRKKSQKRVARNKDFKKIRDDIKEALAKKNKKTVLSEILKKKEDKKKLTQKTTVTAKGKNIGKQGKQGVSKDVPDKVLTTYEARKERKKRKALKKKEYLKRADINEAIEVVLDLAGTEYKVISSKLKAGITH